MEVSLATTFLPPAAPATSTTVVQPTLEKQVAVPTPVPVQGPAGEKGEKGDKGEPGKPGDTTVVVPDNTSGH